jgi:hypothetical protein
LTTPADILAKAEAEAAELAGLSLLAKRDAKIRELKRLLKASQAHAEGLGDALTTATTLKASDLKPIKIRKGKRTNGRDPHTAYALATDWHLFENVDRAETNGLNEHSEEIGLECAHKYTVDLANEVRRMQDRAHLEALVLALGGDFLVNELHGIDSARACDKPPLQEVVDLRPVLQGLIDHLLAELDVPLIKIPCVWGNHGRTTERPRHRLEAAYSYEQLLYTDLALRYQDEPRIKFDVSPTPHKVVDCGGFKVLLTHGDKGLRYGGGVGGLGVPFNRIFGQSWAPTYGVKIATIGHFHQRLMLRTGFVNGSLVGYNAYAKNLGLPFERRSQWLFLIDHERQDVGTACPIWVD